MQTDSLNPAAVVRRAREDIGLSQGALARAAGLQQSNLAAIETGARRAGPDLLDRILRAARLRPSVALELLADHVRELAREYGLHDVRVFGSTVRGTDHERSDVDLLVTADVAVDYFGLAAFRGRAEELLGFPVDVVVDDSDDEIIRAIRREAVPL
ncbi:XRE family transcriptional regulator [Rathayibacter tanaceti]|uniref:Helix-turn-helix domain-containing protein n=2 Tax=Rathayibacter tanaceti TaxID=1671680 RepID=A0A166HIW6_9MICO|nr:XRE family transcriptional regulator [Rathayibacter tanaceti]KZX20674.1 Nucleotidyltransferase domain protein [Rathayibacter tanaceti]QHC54843.1 helix-turn-helix domain-containing protein [Rathayibacter tanaceti]TCO38377.1 putative nucleotidyltransferase [Rathayibacter tanaceti]